MKGLVLFRRLMTLALWPSASWAQVELRGRLLSESGSPVPGATILLTSIGYSVRSDSAGRFALSAARGTTLRLYFTATGFRPDSASVALGRVSIERDFTLVGDAVPVPEANPSATMIRGSVVEENGVPLSYANVQVNYGTRFLADDSGRFQLPYETGTRTLLVRRIGFEPAELTLTAKPDTALRIVLKPIATQLKEVTVVASGAAFRSLDIHGFYGRMKDAERGINRGYFITPEDIERRKPSWITQMVEGFPSIRVCGRVSVTCPAGPPQDEVILGTRACEMTVYLDNIRIAPIRGDRRNAVNSLALPTHVAGMEVYPRAFEAPPQYPSANGNCGVVVIWSK